MARVFELPSKKAERALKAYTEAAKKLARTFDPNLSYTRTLDLIATLDSYAVKLAVAIWLSDKAPQGVPRRPRKRHPSKWNKEVLRAWASAVVIAKRKADDS